MQLCKSSESRVDQFLVGRGGYVVKREGLKNRRKDRQYTPVASCDHTSFVDQLLLILRER